MPIPESQLDTWSKPGSVTQSRDTYGTIKAALEAQDAPHAGKAFTVFLQGSYGNDTNVYSESDVDVVIRTDAVYYSDITGLSEEDKSNYNSAFSKADYTYADFKRDVTVWLITKFGDKVKPGDKAIFVPASGNRRNADVLVAAQFRRYHRFKGSYDQRYDEGICFWTADGTQIVNYPKQHSKNCTTKHQASASWFKPTVRIFKNMRNRMVADGKLEKGLAPSYYIEGLIYNAPASKFGTSYSDTLVSVFDYFNSADRSEFVCANEQYYLLREGSPVTWRAEKCAQFLTGVGDYWRHW